MSLLRTIKTRLAGVLPVRGRKRAAQRRDYVHGREYRVYRRGKNGDQPLLRAIRKRASRRAWHRLVVAMRREGQA